MSPFNQAWQILKEIIDDDLQDAKKARIETLENFIRTNAYSYDKALLEQVVASWQELNRLDDNAGQSTYQEYRDAQSDLEWMELEEVYGEGNL